MIGSEVVIDQVAWLGTYMVPSRLPRPWWLSFRKHGRIFRWGGWIWVWSDPWLCCAKYKLDSKQFVYICKLTSWGIQQRYHSVDNCCERISTRCSNLLIFDWIFVKLTNENLLIIYKHALILHYYWIHVYKILFKFHFIWVESWRCDGLVTWFCYWQIAKPGNKTATPPWPNIPAVHPFM